MGFFAMPNTDHPAIAQNLFRMSGGTNGDDRFEQIGQSWVKHTYGAKQADSCKFGCQLGGDFTHLGVGCSDTYFASQSAVQGDLGSRAWINPFTGVFPTTAREHTGHNHTAISHMILTEDADLNPAMNTGARFTRNYSTSQPMNTPGARRIPGSATCIIMPPTASTHHWDDWLHLYSCGRNGADDSRLYCLAWSDGHRDRAGSGK